MERKLYSNKKGAVQLSEAPAIVILLVTVGIILGIGALVVQQVKDNQISTFSSTVTNTTFTAAQTFTNLTLQPNHLDVGISNDTGLFVSNTSGILQPYRLTATTITVYNQTSLGNGTNGFNITYTFSATDQNAFHNTTTEALSGLRDFASFQSIIAIVVAAAIIIGLVFLLRS